MLVDIVLGVWFVVMPCAMIVILWRILRACQALFSQSWAHHKWWIEKEMPKPGPERHKMPSVPHDPKRDKEIRKRYIERMKLGKEAEK